MVRIKKSLVISFIIALILSIAGVALAFAFKYIQFDMLLEIIKAMFSFDAIKTGFQGDPNGISVLAALVTLAIIAILFIATSITSIVKRRPWLILFGFASAIVWFAASIVLYVTLGGLITAIPYIGNSMDMLEFTKIACTLGLVCIAFITFIAVYIILFTENKHLVAEKDQSFAEYNVTPEYKVEDVGETKLKVIKNTDSVKANEPKEIIEPVPAPAPVAPTPAATVTKKQAIKKSNTVVKNEKVAEKKVVEIKEEKVSEPVTPVAQPAEGPTKRTLTKKEMLEQLKREEEEKAKAEAIAAEEKAKAEKVSEDEVKETAEPEVVVEEEPVSEVEPEVKKEDVEIVNPLADKKVEKAPAEKKIINVYHISQVKTTGQWKVKLGNSSKVIKLFDTQAEAIEYAKALSKNNDRGYLVHSKKGTIRKA